MGGVGGHHYGQCRVQRTMLELVWRWALMLPVLGLWPILWLEGQEQRVRRDRCERLRVEIQGICRSLQVLHQRSMQEGCSKSFLPHSTFKECSLIPGEHPVDC